ncbi:MAG: hypothetical protein JST87_16035 [Bacteroidetes bacterium]|nr:hypothetical protein [Bacteroidota bacterium]
MNIETKTLINSVKLLIKQNAEKDEYDKLSDFEFQVFSQWGDDGIIQYLINTVDIPNKTFIEFGVENYTEANTVFLLINNNWSGFVMDGSESNIKSIQQSEIYWKYDLLALPRFITKENINELLLLPKFDKEVGLLHIDIDGNDYWVWKEINVISPIIVIVEYNSVFGPELHCTIPYKKDFIRTREHFSNLYYGTSIQALTDLAQDKGYYFVGCNSAGNNAYFVRKDKIGNLKKLSAAEGFVASKFRESRDKKGTLTFIGGDERLGVIKGLPIYNTRTNSIEQI